MVCENENTVLHEDDILKMTIDVNNPATKAREQLNLFGYIKRSLRLKVQHEAFIIKPIEEYLKKLDEKKKKQTSIYDISVLVRYRKYLTSPNMILNVQVPHLLCIKKLVPLILNPVRSLFLRLLDLYQAHYVDYEL